MSDPSQEAALTPARLQRLQAQVHPGLFLQRFGTLLDRDGPEILETLFAIAKGNWSEKDPQGQRRLLSDPKDVMTAIRLIKDMGAFDEVMKFLLHVARKGRPKADGETTVPSWVTDYTDGAPPTTEPIQVAPPPEKKPKKNKPDEPRFINGG